MKRLEMGLFGVLLVIFSYVFSHASEINCEIINCVPIMQGKPVKIAWDEVTTFTNGDVIPLRYREPDAIKYFLYISDDKNQIESNPRSFTFDEVPIEPIIFYSPGQYYLGVRAIHDDSNIKQSEICWSDKRVCTDNNPFVLEVVKGNN